MEGHLILAAVESALAGKVPDEVPMPWMSWLLVALCRHQAKQTWAFQQKTRLHELEPGWSYEVDSREEVLLFSGPHDEGIRLPFFGIPSPWVDGSLLALEVASFEKRPLPEARLAHWLPEESLVQKALTHLARQGILKKAGHGPGVYAAGPDLQRLMDPIAATDFRQPEVQDLWFQAMGDSHQIPHWAHRGWAYRDWLYSLAVGRPTPAFFQTLCRCLPDVDAMKLAEQMLVAFVDDTTIAALEMMKARSGACLAWVAQFSRKLDPGQHSPEQAWATAQVLIEEADYRVHALILARRFAEMEKVPNRSGNDYDDRWTFFLLEHDKPINALTQVRRALLSAIPECARNVAAVLALLDQPWCHRELHAALQSLPAGNSHPSLRYEVGPSRQRFLARAMAQSRTPSVRAAAQALLSNSSTSAGSDKVYQVFQRAALERLDELFEQALLAMAPTAERLRRALPANFGTA